MLICFSPQHSHAVYLDSGSVNKKDYKYIMRVLDDALVGYIKAGGKIMKHKFRKNQPGVNVFNHVTQCEECVLRSSSHEGDCTGTTQPYAAKSSQSVGRKEGGSR